MTWTFNFSNTAARAASREDRLWSEAHPSRPNFFDEEYDRALDLIELQPLGYEKAASTEYRNARRYVMQETGHIIFYRVNRRRRTILVLNIKPGKKQTTPATESAKKPSSEG